MWNLLFAVNLLATLILWLSGTSVFAQLHGVDSSSQRILPLPESELSNSQTQMELLKRLRALVAGNDDAGKNDTANPEDVANSKNAPEIDDQQLEQLQQALKKLQDQLPPGIKPPELDSIPKEQLDRAMSDPAVQQQMKKMLEQFSKDGLLPKTDNGGDKSQFPRTPTAEPMPRPNGQLPKPVAPRSPFDPPPSLEPRFPVEPESAPQRGSQAEQESLTPDAKEPQPKPAEKSRQSLKAFKDLLERFKNSQRNPPTEIDDEFMPRSTDPALPRPQNQNSPSTPLSPSSDRSKRVMRRPDRSSPVAPPVGTEPQLSQPRSSQQPRPSQQGEVFPPMQSPPRDVTPRSSPTPQTPAQPPNFLQDQVEPRTKQPSPKSSESESSGLFPSISEFIKEQMRNGFPTPTPEDSVSKSNTQPPNIKSRDMNPGASPPRGTGSGDYYNRPPEAGGDARNLSPPPNVSEIDRNTQPRDFDVRKELENRGLRGTFEKIVQKAKEESRAKQQQEAVAGQPDITPLPQGKTTSPDSTLEGTKSPSDLGLQKSLGDLLSGLDDNLQDIAKDAKFNEPPSNNPRVKNSPRQSQPSKQDSSLGKIRDAASGFFSDLSQAPQAPAASPTSNSAAGGGSPLSTDTPFAIGSLFFVACVLFGIGGLVAYLMRKPLMKLVADATGVTRGHSAFQQNEIRSRADIIAAFHDLALSPRQAVESWWTHQAAAQKLAEESPQSKSAVNTLAEIYEQARYLPDDVELPADKIQSARTALAECR